MVRLRWLEIQGFRSFGASPQRFEFKSDLGLIWGPNSHGKTSVAEAFEFLLTGQIVRRELLGGAKAEFSNCLRNVHLPDTAPVTVKAGIEDDTGALHEVCRTLISDYSAQENCRSALTICGGSAEDLERLGLRLSEPPLRAPVLMHHTLRFVISARPQERADYFKAVLEVQDLEVLRDEVALLIQKFELPNHTAVQLLRRCASIPGLRSICQSLEANHFDAQGIEGKLSQALALVVEAANPGRSAYPQDLAGLVAALRAVVESRREAVFPFAAISVASAGDPSFAIPEFAAVKRFASVAESVAVDTQSLTQLFAAVLAIPGAAQGDESVDCPVCLTAGALTAERIAAIRHHIELSSDFTNFREAAQKELDAVRVSVHRCGHAASSLLPEASQWSVAQHQMNRGCVVELLGASGGERYDQLATSLGDLGSASAAVTVQFAALGKELLTVKAAIDSAASISLDAVEQILPDIGASLAHLAVAYQRYQQATGSLSAPLGAAIDARSQAQAWQALIDVADDPGVLSEALRDLKAHEHVKKELENALRDIDKAKAAVFDAKNAAMSAEIETWWSILRPEQPVAFGGVRRRGAGKRYIDLKAVLSLDAQQVGVERDAVAVFSESQLNCLGLAAFLARCSRESCPIVFLDDPVPASDEAHGMTFARHVVERLLSEGKQVIVSTYDDRISANIQSLYQHRALDVFNVFIDDTCDGTRVRKTSDTIDGLLARAEPYTKSHVPEMRKTAAHALRDAAERLCKEMIVRHSNDSHVITDFDGRSLVELIKAVSPLLTDPSHYGKLRVIARTLNPGSHDDYIPDQSSLVTAFGDIRRFKKDYL